MRSQLNWSLGPSAGGFGTRAVVVGAVAVFWLLAWGACGARAAETIYWGNYDNNSLAFAGIDGGGGGELNVSGSVVFKPEGMAIDSAAGRLYWTNREEGEIVVSSVSDGPVVAAGPEEGGSIGYANLDGSGGGGLLNPAGAPVEDPLGVAIDPTSRIVYWSNLQGNSIAFAHLDGGSAGVLNTAGATMDSPGPIAIDVPGGRIYWANLVTKTISYANLDGSGGGDLNLVGASTPSAISGLAIDPTGEAIYWIDPQNEVISYAALDGSGGADLSTAGPLFDQPYGAALDPLSGRLYWGNYNRGGLREGAISYAKLDGSGGADLTVALAPVAGPQYPVILKPPSGTGAPHISGGQAVGAVLSCSQGSWGADFAGSYVYQAARSYSYRWTRDGEPIEGATGTSYTASAAGTYVCSVTASNYAGSATQSSAAVQVSTASTSLAASTTAVERGDVTVVVMVSCCACAKGSPAKPLRLAMDVRRAQTRPGAAAVFIATVRNTSGVAVKGFRVCAHLWGRAKQELREPHCVWVPNLAAGQERRLKLRVPTRRSAAGDYVVRFTPVGRGASRSIKAKIFVMPEPSG